MLLFLSIILGLVLGIIRDGNISRLGYLKLAWLAILPLVTVVLYKYYPGFPLLIKAVTTTISYLCVMIFIIANRKYTMPAVFLGLGTLSNYVVIAFNSFRMPISPTALSIYSTMTPEAVISQRADYFVATNGANLMFLGDIIYIPNKLFGLIPTKIFEGYMSIGDILLSIGMFLLIVQVMGKNCNERKKSTVDVK